MNSIHEHLKIWNVKNQAALDGGGKSRQEKQREAGKKTARERLDLLLDTDSFEEIDRLAISQFLGTQDTEYTDGVVTGFGTINGRKVALYAQDFTMRGGSLGARHAEKICKIMDLAAKVGCPIIGLIDSGGARIDEGIHALSGYSKIFMRNSRYSGVIPQISVILGPCAGGAVYSPALTDFIFMTEHISQMFITGPQVIEQVLHEKVTKEELGGSGVHGTKSGVAHVISTSEEACFISVKQLLSYLPGNYCEATPVIEVKRSSPSIPQGERQTLLGAHAEPVEAYERDLQALIPANSSQSYDIKNIINTLVDHASFFELQPTFAANIITGLARIEGSVIGIVANQPLVKAGTIDIDASCKAARFIRMCDSFGIPIISLVDVPGYLPGVDQEHHGIIRHGAKLLYAYATATVTKITVILRKAFGGAYIVMGSKELGTDFNFAWPQAQIAVLGAKAAVTILHGKKLAQAEPDNRHELQKALESEYETEFLNPFVAAEHGYIDSIIEPNKTREHIVKALSICSDKVEVLPKKKHGNMPL